MKQIIKRLLAGLLTLLVSISNASEPAPPTIKQTVAHDGILIEYQASADNTARQQLQHTLDKQNLALRSLGANSNRMQISTQNRAESLALLAELRQEPAIKHAELNYRRQLRLLPNDPFLDEQWAINNSGQSYYNVATNQNLVSLVGADLNLAAAWDLTIGSDQIVVAVIDDGFFLDHPDLQANLWSNPGEIPGNGIDDDGNGYVDDIHGWNFTANNADPSAESGTFEGHGSNVAGALGAVGDNGIGITGSVWKVKLMLLKSANLSIEEIVAAMDYARNNGAQIINASYGGPGFSQIEADAVSRLQSAGILLVAAAGNSGYDNDIIRDYPSGYLNDNVLSVASSDPFDQLSSWAQYGALSVDVSAPGEQIFTLVKSNDYDYRSGSSFSAPLTSGVATLLKAYKPSLTPAEIKARIIGASRPLQNSSSLISAGVVDAYTALTLPEQPVLVIEEVKLEDSLSGDSYHDLDADEELEIEVYIKNLWQDAELVSAQLSSDHPLIDIYESEVENPLIAQGEVSELEFKIHLSAEIEEQQRINFRLDLQAAGGYSISRHFDLHYGSLKSGLTYQGVIQRDERDAFQIFYINSPSSEGSLKITTHSDYDIDLYANFGKTPSTVTEFASTSASGDEEYNFRFTRVGTYYIAVHNFSGASHVPFTVTATYTPKEEVHSGGSLNLNWLVLIALLLVKKRCIFYWPNKNPLMI